VERFVYDRDHIKLVFNGSNALIRRYLHGPNIDQVLADQNNQSQVFWTLSDHQGTVRDWLTSAGASQKHVRYDSFGRITQQTGTLSNRFWYTGREWDSEIGLYYYRARYYDPGVGRFISEDPIGFGGQDPNLYRYVGNYSTGLTDPYGLKLVSPVVEPGTSPLVRPVVPPPPPPPPVPAGAASLGVSAILGIILAIPVILLTQEGVSDGTYKQKPRQKCLPPQNKKGKWECKSSCNVQQILQTVVCPDRITGEGTGSSEVDACEAAKRAATQSTPRGCYPRHCRCYDCRKR
jgi:RHS repeat-associated protein